jgi:hypothetical protein
MLLLLCVGGDQDGACGVAERIMIRKRLKPLVLRLGAGQNSSSSSSSSMSGFSERDLADVPSIIAHHAAIAVVWLKHPSRSCAATSSSSPSPPPPSVPSLDPSLWLSHAVLQSKAMFSLVEPGSCLSNRERLLSGHSHWIRLPAPTTATAGAGGIKEVLESAADAIGEIIWPGGSRDRVLTPKCQLRLKDVYNLKENADITVNGGGRGGVQRSSKTSICMIVPTVSPHGVRNASTLPLLDIFLSSFVRSVGCGEAGGVFEFGVYVAYDQVQHDGFSVRFECSLYLQGDTFFDLQEKLVADAVRAIIDKCNNLTVKMWRMPPTSGGIAFLWNR